MAKRRATEIVMWTGYGLFLTNWLVFVVAIASGAPFRFILAALLSLPILYGALWFAREVHQDGKLPWNWHGDVPGSDSRAVEDDWESVPGN